MRTIHLGCMVSSQLVNLCCSSQRRGCIFETLPFTGHQEAAVDLGAFAAARRLPPCSTDACSILLGPAMRQLVTSLLGSHVVIFSDQVRAEMGHADWDCYAQSHMHACCGFSFASTRHCAHAFCSIL